MGPTVEIVSEGDDLFVLADGVKIAKRGPPGAAQARTWVSLEPGWRVLDPGGSACCRAQGREAAVMMMAKRDRPPKPTIAYVRVSTREQGKSGLGLEAQQEGL